MWPFVLLWSPNCLYSILRFPEAKGNPVQTGLGVGDGLETTSFFTLALGERLSRPSLEAPAQGPRLRPPLKALYYVPRKL